MLPKILLRPIALLLGLSVVLSPLAYSDGGQGKNIVFTAEEKAPTGQGGWKFTITTTPVIFRMGTVQNKYHVLLIRLESMTDSRLALDKDKDTIDLFFWGNRKVRGVLSLASVDRPTWDAVNSKVREAAVYPQAVSAKEEEGICVYVRVEDVKGEYQEWLPTHIVYHINSINRDVALHRRDLAAA